MHRLLKAIVMEDDPVLCKLFADTLEKDDRITAEVAHDLPEAIGICQRERQVVLLVDLSVPGARGMQAVTDLRKILPGATLIVITGNPDAEIDAKKAGAHAVIIKGSPQSFGDGLIWAVRMAVMARDNELLFQPAMNAVAKQEKKIEQAIVSSAKTTVNL